MISQKISIPKQANYIIDKIIKSGYEAYIVGGCVRDSLLGIEPKDWDITTSAEPIQIKKLFRRTIDTGIKHGTVTVMIDKVGFEVTTYRIDGEYEDKRRPENVYFTSNLLEDLKRRDFTINAMAYNHIDGLIDAYGGINDLNNGLIKCVGSPYDRFEEDALRMLRAVRFAAQLGYTIEDKTKDAIITKSSNIEYISAERIQVELTKTITSKHPEKIKLAYELGLTKIILPEFDAMVQTEQNNPYHIYNVGEHVLKALQSIRNDRILRWTMLLHDVAKPLTLTTDQNNINHFYKHQKEGAIMAKNILTRLKFDNHTISTVTQLITWHDYDFTLTKPSLRRAINKIGSNIIDNLFEVQKADTLAKNPSVIEDKITHINKVISLYKEIKADNECIQVKQLAINGNDLISLGVNPGSQIGVILNYLLDFVLDNPNINTKDKLICLAKDYIGNNIL